MTGAETLDTLGIRIRNRSREKKGRMVSAAHGSSRSPYTLYSEDSSLNYNFMDSHSQMPAFSRQREFVLYYEVLSASKSSK